MTVLYIAGPMSGLPEFNYPAFHEAEERLLDVGYAVLNPANIDALHNPEPGQPQEWDWYMRHALRQVLDADGIALLPGWEFSRGAKLERHIGRELGIPAWRVGVWLTDGDAS